MENNISKLAIEIATELRKWGYAPHHNDVPEMANIIQEVMDFNRQKQIDFWKERGWLMGTQPFDPLVKT